MSAYAGYRVGDHVVMREPGVKTGGWRGVVYSVTFGGDGAPKHCRVEWTGPNDDGSAWVDDMGMEFFEIRLDPAFIDVPADRQPATVEAWLAS